jgi:hypothetical protein
MKRAFVHCITCIGILVCCALLNVPWVRGFAEEPLYFRDPVTSVTGVEQVSSVHVDLTHALALAAGFSEADARTITIFDQLTDSMRFTSASGAIYNTNCYGAFPVIPNPNNASVCPSGKGEGALLFPLYTNLNTNGLPCVTARPGYFGPFFHFPRTDNGELQNARKWAWGEATVLKGYAAFAWGAQGAEPIDGACHYQMPMNIETGLKPGSLEAYGTYLHMLADSIHHRLCIAAMLELAPTLPGVFGWPTLDPNREPKVCYYDWNNPSNYDENGVEFDSGNGTDRSDDASRVVYEELVKRSLAKEGKYCPIDWNTPLAAMDGSPTLKEACYHFIHNWAFQNDTGDKGRYASLRRLYADQMAKAVRAQRTLSGRAVVTALSPAKSQAAGLGKDAPLTITGKNMTSGTILRWNGEALDATYVNQGKMTAIVPAAHIAAEGSAAITVYNPEGCGEAEGKTFVYSYPSPVLSKLSPAVGALGGPAFTLNLTGKNFVPASKVLWTMGSTVTELPATYVSSARLQVLIESSMLAQTGTAKVQVETEGAKSLKSAKLNFKIK